MKPEHQADVFGKFFFLGHGKNFLLQGVTFGNLIRHSIVSDERDRLQIRSSAAKEQALSVGVAHHDGHGRG